MLKKLIRKVRYVRVCVSLDREQNSLSNDADTLTHLTMDNNIKEVFLAACSDSEFHGQWMTMDT
jgi:hypothetical protein